MFLGDLVLIDDMKVVSLDSFHACYSIKKRTPSHLQKSSMLEFMLFSYLC